LQITALYASLFGVMFVMLMVVVIRLRRSLKIGLGDGGNRDMQQAIRVHGNAVECVPLFLILLATFEINHGSPLSLHLFGGTFLLARVLHAWGLYVSSGASTGRVAGTAVTMTLLVALAIANLSKIF
jgi:uncharacterized membrane protein YecN with MAPEG domain